MNKRTFATRREALEAGPLFPRGGRWIEGVVEYWACPPRPSFPPASPNMFNTFFWTHEVMAFPIEGKTYEDVLLQLDQSPASSYHENLGIHVGILREDALSAKLNPDLTGMEPALSKGGGK